ncbi:MAG TPA: hypothetical protein VJP79_08825, partial [Nitrososphaera sp.]|nr:hypothetical protein [Nitrososphaera sp.]
KWHILDNKGRKLTISREEFMTGVRDELIKKHDGNPVISALDDLTRAMTKAQQVSAMVQSGGDKIEAIPPPQ